MKRTLLLMSLALAIACLGLAGPASAQQTTTGGDGGGGETELPCVCFDNWNNVVEVCVYTETCPGFPGGTTACPGGGACPAGQICIDAANGCGQSVCSTLCGADTCIDSHVFGSGSPYPNCPSEVPALSQAGLILFGVLLLIGMAFVWRRRATMSKGFTASILALLLTASVGTAVVYATIQSNRTCGDPNVVDFVQKVIS
jgi:hypothetical protein